MTALLWLLDAPTRCACVGAYRPRLTGGKLVKAHDPAWRMAEQTRDPGCLQEQVRALAPVYRLGYQHHTDSRKSGRGYPDVHLWAGGGRGSAFGELKRMDRGYPDDRDNPSPDQIRVMAELLDAGHRVYLVRPCCLLTGAVDELMADLAGTRCRYVKGAPAGAPGTSVLDTGTSRPARAIPARPDPALPGAPAPEFDAAVGYVVPMGADFDAVRELEAWLRDVGFPPVTVPFPIRIVVGHGVVAVHVSAGSARVGGAVLHARVWRGGVPTAPFPEHLVDRLRAVRRTGASSDEVMAKIEAEPPAGVPEEAA